MATHSSIPAWRTPQTEEPGKLQSIGVTKSQTRLKQFSTHAQTLPPWLISIYQHTINHLAKPPNQLPGNLG